ncbi:kelch-like protein 22 [Acanthaster planci]|uniref:Kelch-like protein 22 n=1 Tax=Acanthaster planci TaxID=133434 RepID=A0A8B7YGM6_ACAPL|nr:kelch-like protein 22 [Acanthaster planci]XP_022092394.1 kelch-like protein 22 [Acanthaster planci]XP_022092395.1 kelch-like protein 22 [Acanthaster planci]XP_022092397.1 kelch-like protein 22 [Acanthaster planci]
MNQANPQQEPPQQQVAMIRAMRRLRRQMLQAEAGNGEDDADPSDEDEPPIEEQVRELFRRGDTNDRRRNKNGYAEFLLWKKRRETGRQMVEHRMRKRRQELMPQFLINCVSPLFKNPRLSDVTLKVGPFVFHAHKLILCAWSEVFRSLLGERWAAGSPSDEPEVHTLNEHKVCEEYFEDFLRFLYTEEVDLDEDSVFAVLMLADKYLVRDLQHVCVEYLLYNLKTSTAPFLDAIKALKLTEDLSRVEQKSFSLLENHFHLWTTDDDKVPTLYWFEGSLLAKLLQSSNLVVPNETFIFDAVLRWLGTESCLVERQEFSDQLLSLVRFEHIPACDLATLLDDCSAALIPKLKEHIFEALKVRALAGEEAYQDTLKEFSSPRMYLEPMFCVRVANNECEVAGWRSFRELELCPEDNETEFEHRKLSCPVARQSENKNIYLVSKDMWAIGGMAFRKSPEDKWAVRFMLKPDFEDIGRSYRVAVVLLKSAPQGEHSFDAPVTCVDAGDIGKVIGIDVPPTALHCRADPTRLWIKVGIQVFGPDKSCGNWMYK